MDEPLILEDERRHGVFFLIASGFLLFFLITVLVVQPPAYPFPALIISMLIGCCIMGVVKDNRNRYVIFSQNEMVLSRPKWFGGRKRITVPIEGLKAIEAKTRVWYDDESHVRRYNYSFIFMYEDKTLKWSSFNTFDFYTKAIQKIRDQLREVAKLNNLVFVTRTDPGHHLRYYSKMKPEKKIENFRIKKPKQ